MKYIPIFSKDIKNNLSNKVCIIGKVIEIKQARKYIDLKILDPYGYLTARSFEPIDVKEFSTVLILGTVKQFKEDLYLNIRYISELNPEEEIFWRYRFLSNYKLATKTPRKVVKPKEKQIEEKKEIKEEKEEIVEIEMRDPKAIRNLILKAIERLDKGEGVSIEDIVKHTGLDKEIIEKIIEELLMLGEIYEVSLGKLKILK